MAVLLWQLFEYYYYYRVKWWHLLVGMAYTIWWRVAEYVIVSVQVLAAIILDYSLFKVLASENSMCYCYILLKWSKVVKNLFAIATSRQTWRCPNDEKSVVASRISTVRMATWDEIRGLLMDMHLQTRLYGIHTTSTIFRELCSRKRLDSYLSRALSIPLDDDGCLKIVDNSNYVLTLDFAIKMLNINERAECRVPVIIEGETGVGKTALVEMLSKLWNYSLSREWMVQRSRMMDVLIKKITGKCAHVYENGVCVPVFLSVCHHSSGAVLKGIYGWYKFLNL